MEEVKKNIQTFLEILHIGSSESVIPWDESNFKRAQRWGQYAEEVYRKLKNKPFLMEVLSNHIKLTQISSQDTLVTFTFKDLQNATEMLRLVLLNNPHLSSAQFSQVLDMYQVDFNANSSNKDLEKIILDTYSISCSKGIFTTLSTMKKQLSGEHSKKDWKSVNKAEGICLNTYAKLLWTKIGNLMAKQKDCLSDNDIIRNIQSLVLSNEKGMEVVLRMLILQMTGQIAMNAPCNDGNVLEQIKCRIYNWMIECSKHKYGIDIYKRIWSCPSSLLCEMSTLDTSFLESYLTYLHSDADSLLGIGSDLAEDTEMTSYGYCYRYIVEQIQMLMEGPEHVSESCKQKLELWSSSPGGDLINTNPEIPFENEILRGKLWKKIYHKTCK